MKKNLVSIIVTCYNQQDVIAATLKSVLNQSYNNWECIVVNDGSTDHSDEVIQSVIKQDDRFRYSYQANAGVSAARNAGFALAKGDYINFLDGDDTFLPEKLGTQLTVFLEHPEVAICICDHQFYIETENVYKYFKFDKLLDRPLEQILYKWNHTVSFTNHAPLYKRSIWSVDERPFTDDYYGRCEDWVFNVLVALKCEKYHMLENVLCNYHITPGNFTEDTMNVASAAVKAAIYLNDKIPEKYQNDFLDVTIKNSLQLYLDSQRIHVLQSSANWRIANKISKPVITLINMIRAKL